MTREGLRDYVDKQRALNNIPYHVYSELIDGIDTLEQEPCKGVVSIAEVKRIAKEINNDRIKTVNNNVDINKLRNEIDLNTRVKVKHYTNADAIINEVLGVIDKYKGE